MAYFRNCEVKEGMAFPEGMQRIALGVEYSGTRYNGFQRQTQTGNTVQAKLEGALNKIALEDITLVCAGRTDAGVHATNQVVHFDTYASRPEKAWVLGVNTKLPDDIRVHWARSVAPQFHARFSAGNRTYRYIFHSSHIRTATLCGQVTSTHYNLDINLMQQAAKHLVGKHDFSSFRSSLCQARSPIRTITSITWHAQGALNVIEISANAFLHHMVRNIAGTLMAVGRGKEKPEWVANVLAARDRNLAGMTASPSGLYLVGVDYPEGFSFPCMQKGPIFLGL